MHANIQSRSGKFITVNDRRLIDFSNCSYLGLDTNPELISAAQDLISSFGIHFCCARSRLSIEPLQRLEEGLSQVFGAPAVTFPSVSAAHLSVLPLLASGLLIDSQNYRNVCLVFDRFAHASMQSLKKGLASDAEIMTIEHNDIRELESIFEKNREANTTTVFVGDGIYSMGGSCNIEALLELQREGLWLYLDDAHGTSIIGHRGCGYVASKVASWPSRLICTFSLAKGFGCNGGGVVLPDAAKEELVRFYGQTYSFSAPLDFAVIGAALKSLELHLNGTIEKLQQGLYDRVKQFRRLMSLEQSLSPICMVPIGDEENAIQVGASLLERGFFVPTIFYPVVQKAEAKLRICLSLKHSKVDLRSLAQAIKDSSS